MATGARSPARGEHQLTQPSDHMNWHDGLSAPVLQIGGGCKWLTGEFQCPSRQPTGPAQRNDLIVSVSSLGCNDRPSTSTGGHMITYQNCEWMRVEKACQSMSPHCGVGCGRRGHRVSFAGVAIAGLSLFASTTSALYTAVNGECQKMAIVSTCRVGVHVTHGNGNWEKQLPLPPQGKLSALTHSLACFPKSGPRAFPLYFS